MLELIDLSWLPILFGISFGSKSAGGSSQETRTENQGLLPAQKTPLSAYIGPQLQNLYGYATSYLYPTNYNQATTRPVLNSQGQPVVGPPPNASGATAPQVGQDVSEQYGFNPGTYYRVPDAQTGFRDLDAGQYAAWSGNAAAQFAAGQAPVPLTEQVPATLDTTTDKTFRLPGLDANGLYGGQTSAITELLNRAAGGLNTSAQGLDSGVLANALPGLFDTIGKQTVAQVEVPEQVRQQRVQDVNAVLQLMSAALGSSSAGSGSRNFSSSAFNFSIKKPGGGGGGSGGGGGNYQDGSDYADSGSGDW